MCCAGASEDSICVPCRNGTFSSFSGTTPFGLFVSLLGIGFAFSVDALTSMSREMKRWVASKSNVYVSDVDSIERR